MSDQNNLQTMTMLRMGREGKQQKVYDYDNYSVIKITSLGCRIVDM